MTTKSTMPNAMIMLARCARLKDLFGIRVEEIRPDVWNRTWAFKINESVAKKEGFSGGKISGMIQIDKRYPGCPHCGSKGILVCGKCGEASCWDGQQDIICPWCSNRGKAVAAEKLQFKTGQDR